MGNNGAITLPLTPCCACFEMPNVICAAPIFLRSCAPERWAITLPLTPFCARFEMSNVLCSAPLLLCSFAPAEQWGTLGPLHSHSLPLVRDLKCPTSSVLPPFPSAAAHQNDGAITLPLTSFCARFAMSNVLCSAPIFSAAAQQQGSRLRTAVVATATTTRE